MSNPNSDRYGPEISKCGAVIATNKQLYDIGVKANPNCTIIPNGVDLDLFKPAPETPNFNRNFTIGFAGNIHGAGAEYKGWKEFVVGHTLLARYGVEQHHMLHKAKQIAHEDMPEKFYHEIDALILPSKGEGCSNVVSEALSCGVVCILTKVGYHGEMLTDGVNCLFIDRDTADHNVGAADIAAKVRMLIEQPELRKKLSVAGREFAAEHHDVKKVAAAYDAVFKGVLKANASAER